MLKALELIGFKSFADKTRFDFPPGITVVVGPNGSGKSNIVDAIKWVLGEQSAKSLRGKDMADVIFKGSADGRRMLNTAEATIIFENGDGRLPVDAPEVHVTRRVYRSGEGEYLINREPCRLKDIKDLFRGTGVGTDAYSLIEQGKVDRLLQASPRERRSIFEEAAGISRFKAKKLEAQRRLERVEQNLLRLSDIVDEVESRLRSVRSQASKARRYREYTARLQELRTQVGLTDWRQLSDKLQAIEKQSLRLGDQAAEISAEIEAQEARALELDVEVARTADAVRACEARMAQNHEQIALGRSASSQGYARLDDLDEAALRHRRQLAAMTGRADDLLQRLRETSGQLEEAEAAFAASRQRLNDHQQAAAARAGQLEQLRGEHELRQNQHADDTRRVAELSNQISSRESELAALLAAERRSRQRMGELDNSLAQCQQELDAQQSRQQQLTDGLEVSRQAVAEAEAQLAAAQEALTATRDDLAAAGRQFSGVKERAAVLEELENSQEGLAIGVRDVLELARESSEGPFAAVQGLVADLLQVSVDIAPLVDVALGERAQHVVLADGGLLDEIQAGRFQPAGRVGFVCLDDGRPGAVAGPELDGLPGVVGRLDRLVTCSPRIKSLLERLLGQTWLVESLQVALALAPRHASARFVTQGSDLVETDGTITVGPRAASAGLVSRRSQLHALRLESATLKQRIEALEAQASGGQQTVNQRRAAVRELSAEFGRQSDELGEQRVRTRAVQERRAQLQKQRQSVQDELDAALGERQALAPPLEEARGEKSRLAAELAKTAGWLQETERQIEQLDGQRQQHAVAAAAAQVELQKNDEHRNNLRARRVQFEEDQRERARSIRDAQAQLSECLRRRGDTRRELLRGTTRLALMYLEKESLAREAVAQAALRQTLAEEKTSVSASVQTLRRQAQRLDEQLHRQELAAGEVRHQRNTLAERLREDYGIDLSQLENAPSEEQQQERAEVETEISDLRRKINNIGAVNVDALEELDDLETRFGSLSGQLQDLTQAKDSLERIIVRINADSRRLFQETLEAIRVNFQTLYRKSFGGGRADIVLEEGVDPLEAGVDIIATPPGKQSFNNSLLSGGEKALTAVALLLGIFQYRPSPFCVLDEVDAPFDEANIGRFIDVLKGFLGWTKFVVVTHSKKTMTAATTLYGVTMQESGVSKQVSVRFEDVSDDGQINADAIHRNQTGGPDDERGAA